MMVPALHLISLPLHSSNPLHRSMKEEELRHWFSLPSSSQFSYFLHACFSSLLLASFGEDKKLCNKITQCGQQPLQPARNFDILKVSYLVDHPQSMDM